MCASASVNVSADAIYCLRHNRGIHAGKHVLADWCVKVNEICSRRCKHEFITPTDRDSVLVNTHWSTNDPNIEYKYIDVCLYLETRERTINNTGSMKKILGYYSWKRHQSIFFSFLQYIDHFVHGEESEHYT